MFPEADQDPVIQITNMVQVQGEKEPRTRIIFTLGTCAPIAGSQVVSFADERLLLAGWARFVGTADPDILTGMLLVLLGSCLWRVFSVVGGGGYLSLYLIH